MIQKKNMEDFFRDAGKYFQDNLTYGKDKSFTAGLDPNSSATDKSSFVRHMTGNPTTDNFQTTLRLSLIHI